MFLLFYCQKWQKLISSNDAVMKIAYLCPLYKKWNEMTILACILHLIVCVINMSHVCIKWIVFYPADSIFNNGSTKHNIFLAVTYQWLFADAPDREAEFESKSAAFEDQANQIADTAVKLANAGGNTNKRLLDQIRQNAEEVSIIDRFASFGAAILLCLQYITIIYY